MTHYKYNIVFAFILTLFAASLKAETKEYIHAFIDKDCYLTGEQILVNISITDKEMNPLDISKIAYVELCDTRQRQTQCMVQLTNGKGWAKLDLPGSMHSGNYQMTVYTRYLRNFGKDSYFKRLVSVINLLNPSENDDIEFVEDTTDNSVESANAQGATVLTDKQSYNTREKVVVSVPETNGRPVTVSVSRKDCETDLSSESFQHSPKFNKFNELKFVPEFEGHIVTAKTTGTSKIEKSMLAAVGKKIKAFDGQSQEDGTMRYYTKGLNGSLSMTINGYTETDDPLRMEFVLPYETVLPDSLPSLRILYKEKDLRDRSISAQIEKSKRDVLLDKAEVSENAYLGIMPEYYYDLDEYTKFMTVREILIEFISGIRTRTVNKHKALYTFEADSYGYSRFPALVLLDGMPVYDIESLMDYDARRLKYVKIYRGRFQFGENCHHGIIAFESKKGLLQDFLLDKGTQMFTYDFPQIQTAFISPIYDGITSRQPDFRHTLYFNPNASGTCEFYTSDLPGTYVVTIQYLDKERAEHKVQTEIEVK